MTESPVILFPHTQITPPKLREAVSIFGRLTICQPWFSDPLTMEEEELDPSLIRILYPSADVKPKGDFKRLIAEYRQWIRQDRGKSSQAFLRASSIVPPSEDTSWEIKARIRKGENEVSAPPVDHALKWHLTLHLAREIEENMLKSTEMLRQVKKKKSPVEDALEDASTLRGLFEDLSITGTEPLMESHLIVQIIDSWLGLFGEFLEGHGSLITFDSQVMEHVLETFESETAAPLPEAPPLPRETAHGRILITRRRLPVVPDSGGSKLPTVLPALSGRTIILIQDLTAEG